MSDYDFVIITRHKVLLENSMTMCESYKWKYNDIQIVLIKQMACFTLRQALRELSHCLKLH